MYIIVIKRKGDKTLGTRLNIGLFVDKIDAVFTSEAVKGAEMGAMAIDANMYIFPGMYLDGEDISEDHIQYEYQYNTLFQFVSEKHLDVLYIMMGMIGCRVNVEEQIAFLKQFLNIPIVTLYTKMDGYQSIIFDNQSAFMQGIRHLIVDHNARKIGYVSGPKTNVDAMERFDAYQKVLKETGIPYNEDYVIYGNFEESSEKQIGAFVASHPELDAVVFANDRMALGGYRAFAKMGIKVGRDLLVVSFDNSSFAPSLTPPLTTVEANAAELSYKAIINAETFVKTGKLDNLKVNTHFIRRSSCGCRNFDFQTSSERLGISHIFAVNDKTTMLEQIYHYLFGKYAEGESLRQIKYDISTFIEILCEIIEKKDFKTYWKDVIILFNQIISLPLFHYTSAEQFSDVLMSLQHEMRAMLENKDQYIELMELFSTFYRDMAIRNYQIIHGQLDDMERISRIISKMTVDIFRMNKDERLPYERTLDNLSSIDMRTAYLFTFTKPLHHPREKKFEKPDQILFRAYYTEEGAFGVPENQQLINTDDIFINDHMPKDRRFTMILSPLFSCEDLYGILMSELHYENYRNLTPVAIQISVALKSLLLLDQQNKMQKQFQETLTKMTESNIFLSEISKTDQLTGLYNRWGFLEHVQATISNPINHGKEIMVLYADMDNLKMINDIYGHDEGDFALREIAAILKETFRSTDIVARFGGDEFVAFAVLGIPDYEAVIKKRIAEITMRHNESANKPYPIEMSTGIYELLCEPAINISATLEMADKKLYKEKRTKKEMYGKYR